jgi:glutamate decarboxylase
VCFHFKHPEKADFNLYELSDRLRMRGWQVPAFSLPANVQDIVVMRVMVRQGFTMDMATLLVEDMKRAICHLKKYRSAPPMKESDGMTFKHT